MQDENLINYIEEYINNNNPNNSVDFLYSISDYCLNKINGIYYKINNFDNSVKLSKLLILLSKLSHCNLTQHYNNLIAVLNKSNKFKESLEICEKALKEIKEDDFDLWYNYAIALKNLKQYEKSIDAFRKAEELNPEFPMTHYQLSTVLLPLGRFKEAFQENEWRFLANSALLKFRKRFDLPFWDGSKNKKILLFSEQGFGDCIQNTRYIKYLKAISKYVGFEIQEELYHLYDNNIVDNLIPRNSYDYKEIDVSNYDFILSINSLPYWFDSSYEFDEEEIYLDANQKFSCSFDFSEYQEQLKVGIVWAGSPWHISDFQRSCYLKYFKPLIDMKNIKFFSLQDGDMIRSWYKNESIWEGKDNYDVVNLVEGCESFANNIVDLLPYIKNFNDTALMIKNLDIIITVDTSVAHLAGSMGKKVWFLLSHSYEWRWRRKIYKNLKFFKQPSPGDWTTLIENVKKEIIKVI